MWTFQINKGINRQLFWMNMKGKKIRRGNNDNNNYSNMYVRVLKE